MGDVTPVKKDVPPRGRVDAADAVEDACLAGAVWPDDGKKVAGLDLEAHTRERCHTTKAQVQVIQSQQLHDGAPLPMEMIASR
jgi:hypothetical protein